MDRIGTGRHGEARILFLGMLENEVVEKKIFVAWIG